MTRRNNSVYVRNGSVSTRVRAKLIRSTFSEQIRTVEKRDEITTIRAAVFGEYAIRIYVGGARVILHITRLQSAFFQTDASLNDSFETDAA